VLRVPPTDDMWGPDGHVIAANDTSIVSESSDMGGGDDDNGVSFASTHSPTTPTNTFETSVDVSADTSVGGDSDNGDSNDDNEGRTSGSGWVHGRPLSTISDDWGEEEEEEEDEDETPRVAVVPRELSQVRVTEPEAKAKPAKVPPPVAPKPTSSGPRTLGGKGSEPLMNPATTSPPTTATSSTTAKSTVAPSTTITADQSADADDGSGGTAVAEKRDSNPLGDSSQLADSPEYKHAMSFLDHISPPGNSTTANSVEGERNSLTPSLSSSSSSASRQQDDARQVSKNQSNEDGIKIATFERARSVSADQEEYLNDDVSVGEGITPSAPSPGDDDDDDDSDHEYINPHPSRTPSKPEADTETFRSTIAPDKSSQITLARAFDSQATRRVSAGDQVASPFAADDEWAQQDDDNVRESDRLHEEASRYRNQQVSGEQIVWRWPWSM
jgi:hypothetical protein